MLVIGNTYKYASRVNITRRNLIKMSAGALLLAAAVPPARLFLKTVDNQLLDSVSSGFYDAKLGALYLQQTPWQLADLHKALEAKIKWHDYATAYSTDRIVRTMVKRDYKQGNTMLLFGWILPETTVYLSALAALEGQG